MAIIYDGVLQDRTVEYIDSLLHNFGEVLEMYKLPDGWTEWSEANMEDYVTIAEDCQGQPYGHKSKSYGLVRRNDPGEPLFVFFKTRKEKQLVMDAFPDLVLNESPFTTIIRP